MILLVLNGCGMAVKTVMDTARGGTCDFFVIEPVQNLQSYDNLDIIFTSAVGGRLNTKLLADLNDKILAGLSENSVKQTQGRQLRVLGAVLHLADGVLEKQILVQVRFQDAVTGQSIGLVNATGQANSIRGLTEGVDAVATGVIKLLAKNHFPGIKDPP
jgi:hypothetical protein